jgi:hypothetical protein
VGPLQAVALGPLRAVASTLRARVSAVRRLIDESPSTLLEPEAAGRRDIHLDECVHCRAFALRGRGALELLPLPAAGLLDRIASRVGGLLGRGESLAGLRDGSEVAVVGGTAGAAGAGTALTAGLGAKFVAMGCAGAALAAVCVGPAPREAVRHRPAAKRAAVAPAGSSKQAARSKPSADSAPVAFVAATASPSPSGSAGSDDHASKRDRSSAVRKRRARASAAQEFGPEGATAQRLTGPRVKVSTNRVPRAAAAPSTSGGSASSASSSSSFGGEFAP